MSVIDLKAVTNKPQQEPGKKVADPKEAAKARLEQMTIKYGANKIYEIDRLPKAGSLIEYIDQMVIVTYPQDGKMENLMLTSVKPDPNSNDKLLVTGFDRESKERKFTVGVIGSGLEDETKREVRIFPPSYAQFISEVTIFHKSTLKKAWEKCKQISKIDFKSYESDSGTAKLNTTDNIGLIIKLADDDYLYIRATKVEWHSKDKTFTIHHEDEGITIPTPSDFGKGEFNFTHVKFTKRGWNLFDNAYQFDDLKCKIIDLKDLCA
jgi:hypothetical protein